MSETRAQQAKDRILKIYGGGVVAFIAVFSLVAALAVFFAHLK